VQHFAHGRGLILYLASIERHAFGECEDGEDDEYGYDRRKRRRGRGGMGMSYEPTYEARHTITYEMESSLELTRVVDIYGAGQMHDLDVEEDNILQDSPFEDRNSDEEGYDGYTGNAGA